MRGDFDALLRFPLTDAVRHAIALARLYDAAAGACFPGFFASRRNYDVMQGIDSRGTAAHAVSSSNRGGSAARAAPRSARSTPSARTLDCESVRAVSVEIYGESPPPPADAVVYFRGVDARVGPLTKYSRVEPDADARRAG